MTEFLILSIVGISLYAGWCLYIESQNLKQEEHLLRAWRKRLETLPLNELQLALDGLSAVRQSFLTAQKQPNRFDKLISKGGGGPGTEHLVDQAVRSVWQGRNTDADLEAISSMLLQRESGRLSFPYAAPNLCMLLGLVGTVLGLAFTIPELATQLRQATTSADPKLLGNSLGATLSNMQSAFYATLAGVTGALLVGFFTRHISHKQTGFLAELQDFVISELGPRVLPQNKEATVEDLAQALKDIRLTLRKVPAMMESAASAFGEALASSGLQMSETLQGLQGVSTQIQASLASAAGDVRGSAERLTEATSAIAAASGGLQAYHQDLTASHRQMLELFAQSRSELELQISAQLSSISGFQEQVMRSTSEIVSRIVDATSAFQAAGVSHHEAASDSTRRVTEFRESVAHGFGELQINVGDVFKQHQLGLDRVSAEFLNLAGKFDPVLLDQEWKKIQDSIVGLDQSVASLGTTLQQIKVEELVSATHTLQSLVASNVSLPTNPSPIPSYEPRPIESSDADRKAVTDLNAAVSDMRDSAHALTLAARALTSACAALGPMVPVGRPQRQEAMQPVKRKRNWFGYLTWWRK